MMTTPEQIQQAMQGLADLAPAPDRLRACIPAAIRTRLQRRALLLAGAGVAATAAVGVPAAVALRQHRTGPPGADLTRLGDLSCPLLLRPTWLPSDLVEIARQWRVDVPALRRTWATPAAISKMGPTFNVARNGDEGLVILTIEGPQTGPQDPPIPTPSQPHTVAGQPATLNTSPNEPHYASLEWKLNSGGSARLNVAGIANPDQAALQMANALVPDPSGRWRTSLGFRWLPATVGPVSELGVHGSHDGWAQWVTLSGSEDLDGVEARLATSRDLIGHALEGDHTTVRGRPGRAFALFRGYGEAAVELDNGRWLDVRYGSYTGDEAHHRATAIRIANNLDIGPDPDLTWISRR